MIANILAIIFLLKLSSKTHLNAPALLSITTNQGEASAAYKCYDHSHHVLVRWKSEQFARKATIPNDIVGRRWIY